jgi:hypothetical protein
MYKATGLLLQLVRRGLGEGGPSRDQPGCFGALEGGPHVSAM